LLDSEISAKSANIYFYPVFAREHRVKVS